MDRLRDEAIRVRRKEQEHIVRSRKRKLRDLYAVTRHIDLGKSPIPAVSGIAFGEWPTGDNVDEAERRYLELTDIELGRFYDDKFLGQVYFTGPLPISQPSASRISQQQSPSHLPSINQPVQVPTTPKAHLISPSTQSPIPRTPPPARLAPREDVGTESDSIRKEGKGSEVPEETSAVRSPLPTTKSPLLRTELPYGKSWPKSPPADASDPNAPQRQPPEGPVRSNGLETRSNDSGRPLAAQTNSLEQDVSAPIANIDGIPVIQSSLPPITSAVAKRDSTDGISIGSEATVHPFPPPSPPFSRQHELAGAEEERSRRAQIERSVHESLEKLPRTITKPSTPPHAASSPLNSEPTISPLRRRSPALSQPQLQVITPAINRHVSKTYDTPSSPISSDEDDDDRDVRDENAMISSATSPDAGGLLPEVSSTTTVLDDVENKRRVVGDPSAQLRLEEQLAIRKETTDGEEKFQASDDRESGPTASMSTAEDSAREEPSIERTDEAGKCADVIARTEINSDGPASTTLEVSLITPITLSEPYSSGPQVTGCCPETQEATDQHPSDEKDSDELEASEDQRASEPLPSTDTNESTAAATAQSKETPVTASDRVDLTLPSTVAPHLAVLEAATLSELVPSIVTERAQSAIEAEKISSTAVEIVRKENPQKVAEEAPVPGTPKVDSNAIQAEAEIAAESVPMNVDEQVAVTAQIDEDISVVADQIATKEPMLGESVTSTVLDAAPQISTKTLNEEPTPLTISSSLLELLEQQKEREKLRARLTKIVFNGEPPFEDKNKIVLFKRPSGARVQQDVNSFLSYNSTRRASTSTGQQISKRNSGSITLNQIQPYGSGTKQKDYLTPLFQLEAFENSLHELVSKSHKTLLTANHQLCLQEQQAKKVFRRVQQLQEQGKWGLRQPARAAEPKRRLCHWDHMLREVKWMSTDFKQERRYRLATCKQIAEWVLHWHEAGPESRNLLCVNKTDMTNGIARRRQKRGSVDMSTINQDAFPRIVNSPGRMDVDQVHTPVSNNGEHQSLDHPMKTETDADTDGLLQHPPGLIPRDDSSEIGNDEDPYGYLDSPPAGLFALGSEETFFDMPHTASSERMLSELPLFSPPPPPPVDASALEDGMEEVWSLPIIPVSKYALGKIVLKEEGPPRKKSRYEYEENYNLFADDSDGEVDISNNDFRNGSFLRDRSHQIRRPTPLPPEQTNVALFNPDHKHILNRMQQGHSLKPPNYLPPVGFFETRAPSQWLPSEDEKLKDLVQKYPQNWSLISTFMSFKSEHQSASERRSPWECFERYLHIENIPPEFTKNPWYKGIQQRLEIAGKANGPYAVAQSSGSGANTPTARRRGNLPYRVERRRNTKFTALFESMRKLAKRRELNLTKQQNAATRKTDISNQANKTKLGNFVPANLSKMKWEREQKVIERANHQAQLAGQAQRHHLQQRVGTPGSASPVIASNHQNGLAPVPPGSQLQPGSHRASPLVNHAMPNGSATGIGAPVPGMGVNHNGMSGVNQPAASGAAAANAMALGLRGNGVGPTGVPQGRYSQEQINQIMRMKAQQLAAQQNGMPNGISINYPQHAILAAQQQAINAATSTNKHAANGNVQHDNMGNNANGVLPQPHNRQPSMMAAGHAGSPRVQQAQHSQNAQLISQWIQSSNPNLSPADVQKLTNQRLQEYHMRISAQMASATTSAGGGIPNGIPTNGLSAHQQQLYQQQQAMRHQQQLLQQRQGSQGPNISQQASLGGNVSGTVGASTPPTHPNHLQKSVSMQGQQMQKQPSQQQGQQQSPRLTQAPMTSGPPQQPQH